MDDAVLDAGDHTLRWNAKGWSVTVVSVFTSFGTSTIPQSVRRAVGMNDLTNLRFEKMRVHEDKRAMKNLGVRYKHLNFVDAAFRGQPFGSIFNGYIRAEDEPLVRKLADAMRPYKDADKLLVPLGVGGHIDHLAVRKAAEELFPHGRLGYYVDYPYALRLSNWRLRHLKAFFTRRISVLKMSRRKRQICESYTSQIPVLFSHTPDYWECVINV